MSAARFSATTLRPGSRSKHEGENASITAATAMTTYRLEPPEVEGIDRLLGLLVDEVGSPEDPAFLGEARRLAFSALPMGPVRFLERFRRDQLTAAVLVTGYPIDAGRIGPTPHHWGAQPDPESTLREELYLTLLGSLLGDAFGWATLQDGRLVQNVLPMRGEENEQSGHGSSSSLAWHTEDGFHPYRCDYLGLMALRNPGRVPTTVASIDAVHLSAENKRILAQPRFFVHPDNEHLKWDSTSQNGSSEPLPGDWYEPRPTSVLFGDLSQPYLRIDPIFMSAAEGDHEGERALADIIEQLDSVLTPEVIGPGDVCFIDNYRAVHGRGSFSPSYDGADRWLKKTVLTRDLRKSRSVRWGHDGRVLHPGPLWVDGLR